MADSMCGTYEVVYHQGAEEVEIKGEVWLLGQYYNMPSDFKRMESHKASLIWCTYRKNFRAIGGTPYTSDSGWGCTMRCGQMLLAEALTRLHLGNEWRWKSGGCSDRRYHRLLRMFLDKPDSVYALQQIAQFGVDLHRKVGEWFGPNNMCQVIKKLALYDGWSNLAVHVSMDMTIIESEIFDLCCGKSPAAAKASSFVPGGPKCASVAGESSGAATADDGVSVREDEFKPLLLFIPLRLGLETFEKKYTDCLKACFMIPQSVGVIGGRPRNAYWFYGCQSGENGKLFYLDPHTVQMSIDPTMEQVPDETYHYMGPTRLMAMYELEPSMAVGFFCTSREEVADLFVQLRENVLRAGPGIFEIFKTRPRNMPAVLDAAPHATSPDDDTDSFHDLADESLPPLRDLEQEDDFEIIEFAEGV